MRIIVVSPHRLEWHNGYCYLVSTIRFSGYEIAYRPRIIYSAPDVTSVQLMEEAKAKFEPEQVDYQPNMLLPLADEGYEEYTLPLQLHGHTDAELDVLRYNLTERGYEALHNDNQASTEEPTAHLDWDGRPFTEY